MAFSRDVGRLVLSFFGDGDCESLGLIPNFYLRVRSLAEAKEMEEVFDLTWPVLTMTFAASTNDLALVRHLMKKEVPADAIALTFAITNCANEVVLELLRSGVDPSSDVITNGVVLENLPFITAAACNNVAIARELLKDDRVNPASHRNMAITKAAENGHTDMVRLLLADSRVDPTYEHYSPSLEGAIRNGHIDVVKILIQSNRFNTEMIRSARKHASDNRRHAIGRYLDSILRREPHHLNRKN